MCVPERAVPHGALCSRVTGSVGSSGVFLTPLLPHTSQWDTMTRQLSSHVGLVGLGRLALPFDLKGLIIEKPAYGLLITGQEQWLKLKKDWGSRRSVLIWNIIELACTGACARTGFSWPKYSCGLMCSCRGRAVSWLKAGVSSKQFWKSETRAKMYRPSLALDMATTNRLTSLWSGGRKKIRNKREKKKNR